MSGQEVLRYITDACSEAVLGFCVYRDELGWSVSGGGIRISGSKSLEEAFVEWLMGRKHLTERSTFGKTARKAEKEARREAAFVRRVGRFSGKRP